MLCSVTFLRDREKWVAILPQGLQLQDFEAVIVLLELWDRQRDEMKLQLLLKNSEGYYSGDAAPSDALV